MSHEISIRENGFAEFAYAAKDGAAWHNLGQAVEENQSIEVWAEKAGFDWTIEQAPVLFNDTEMTKAYEGNYVLYRSDTKAPLSIVSHKFKIVQPMEILEFFREAVTFDGMRISTVGMLYGGKKFWAMVDTGREFSIGKKDKVTGNIVLTTGTDGLNATRLFSTSVRIVCKNTMSAAMNSCNDHHRTTHRQEFNPDMVKQHMGMYDEKWNTFKTNIQLLANTKVTDKKAEEFMYNLVKKPDVAADEQPYTVAQQVNDLLLKFRNGVATNGSTAWDLVNAVTEYVDHGVGSRKRSVDRLVESSLFGAGNQLKNRAYDDALLLV